MPRPNKIWYWKARGEWCVKIDGKRYRLGPDRKTAERKFHELKAHPEKRVVAPDSVAAVLDDFLDWTGENRAEKTYRCYRDFCQSFLDDYGAMLVAELSTEHVTTWLKAKKTWNNTTKRDAITCLQRAFNWATKNRGLERNPISGMEKPKPNQRTVILTEDEFNKIIKATPDQQFADLITVSWECGCRPQEVKELEARHVDLEHSCWLLPTNEAKGENVRVVYMTVKAERIVKRLVRQYPEGKLFRNTKGNPWTGFAVKCRFARLEEKLGKRYRQYDFRHTWITNKLRAGIDSHIVAALSGHSDTKMIDRVYSHVADDREFMLKQARKKA